MPVNKIKELEKYKSKVAVLEKEIATAQKSKLASLHKEVGFESTDALIAALKGLSQKTSRKRAKRTRLTPAIKKNIVSAIKGGLKGAEAAKKYGVSIPTIQNIKREFGLVKTRKAKKAAKKKASKPVQKKKRVVKTAKKVAANKVAKKAPRKKAKK